MVTTAVIKIEQFDSVSNDGVIREQTVAASNTLLMYEETFTKTGEYIFTHLPNITQPVAKGTVTGWMTEDKDDWYDSPTRFPTQILYRHRFAYGRDRLEVFDVGGGEPPLTSGAEGERWGNLDNNSGLLIKEEVKPLSSSVNIKEFRVSSLGSIQEAGFSSSGDLNISHIGGVEGDVDLEQFPFLVTALPVPYSIKNPVDTDIYIRISNYSFPIASGTITLYVDDVLQSGLDVDEFFGGLGGFDVTWPNSMVFDYDTQVNVRWEFFDTDSPANQVTLSYPFYTIPDLAAPRVSNFIPSHGTTDVSISGFVQFDLEDFETDVDIDTLVLYVNNVLAEDGVNGDIQLTRLTNLKGYTVRFTPYEPWLYGDEIPVAIFVKDISDNANELFYNYSFTTEESLPPRLLNIRPLPCTVAIPTKQELSVDVIDGGHGLEKDSIVLTVDEIERGGQIILIPIIHRDE